MTTKNVLFITSDQQHWNTLGVLNPEVRTPNLDRLAADGHMFSRAYCPNPTCTPTRASLITGQYPSQHGAYSLGTKLPEDVTTIGDVLKEHGYRRSLIGKAHFQPLRGTEQYPAIESESTIYDLDFWREFSDAFYGFDHIELVRNHTNEHIVGQHYVLWLEEQGLTNWRDYFRTPTGTMDPREKHAWAIPEQYHYNTWISQQTAARLQEHAESEEPFFLWASFPDPHPPYLVPEPWASMYDPQDITLPAGQPDGHRFSPPHFRLTQEQNPDFSAYAVDGVHAGTHGFHSHVQDEQELRRDIAVYYGMISMMDHCIGEILDALEKNGLQDDTLVVFTTDHGHCFGHHDLIAKGPFHYEDLLRVPFIVRQPGLVPADQRSDSLLSLVDFAPSVLSMLGIDIPNSMTGLDQSSVWKGQGSAVRDHVIVENRHQPDTVNLKTYIDQRYKLTVYLRQPYGELYDLEADPGEFQNLWDDPRAAQLKSELLQKLIWAEMEKEPLLMPRVWGA